ncbi:NAD-dependent histone deacetylase sir2 [Gryganskiella cystojenkinii]|nr:NAD-dependent histone deacetylase sir2 [Gryganskiella cystojenkinii]
MSQHQPSSVGQDALQDNSDSTNNDSNQVHAHDSKDATTSGSTTTTTTPATISVTNARPPVKSISIEPTTHSTRLYPPPILSPTFRPGSPVNRKRSEVKDDDIVSSNDHFFQNFYNVGGAGSSRTGGAGSSSTFPPLKKSKTSPPLSQSNLTAYRSSREAQDPLSPQTSPIIEPYEPFFDPTPTGTISTITLDATTPTYSRRGSPTNKSGGGTPPLLRSRTMEEISARAIPASVLDSLSKASATAIGNLTLGGGAGGAGGSARAIMPERTMGVITSRPNSRQGSPTVTMTSRESTPMQAEDASYHPLSRVSNKRELSVTPSEETVSSEDSLIRRNILDTLDDYNEDADPDYEPAADTTVDEDSGTRPSSPEPDGEDSFDEIDEDNIQVAFDDDGGIFYVEDADDALDSADVFIDTDPNCEDRFTESEIAELDEEARTEGIAHMMQKYVWSERYPAKKLLLMFFPYPEVVGFPEGISKRYVFNYLCNKWQEDLSRRRRLEHIHKLEQVIELLKNSKNIMVLTGAGVSVSCGIPDFRSPDGIYSRLSEFQLRDPQQMFDLRFFRKRPEIFYSFAREIFPSNFMPSPSHNFIKLLEDKGKLLRNYTQNIDTLEQKAGIHNILQCHGSFATASCVRCHHQVPGNEIKDAIFNQEVAYCKVCTAGEGPSLPKSSTLHTPSSRRNSSSKARVSSALLDTDDSSSSSSSDEDDENSPALMKPDIVFFGEPLPSGFNDHLEEDRLKADLLIVIGSSLKVAPVSDIMLTLPPKIPQILINRTPITHTEFDVQLLGNCDTIVAELCRMAGWELNHEKLPGGTSNVPDMDTNTNANGAGQGGRAHWSLTEPNTYLFEGAILGDIEYESSQKRQLAASASTMDVSTSGGINKGRKRGRFEGRSRFRNGGAASSTGDGSSSDADDEQGPSRRYGRSRERMEMDHVHAEIESDDGGEVSDNSQATVTRGNLGEFITIAAESLENSLGGTGASWSPFGLSAFSRPKPSYGATGGEAIVLSSSAPTSSFQFGIPSKSTKSKSGNISDHQTKTSSFFQTVKGFDIPNASGSGTPAPRSAPLTFSPAPPRFNQEGEAHGLLSPRLQSQALAQFRADQQHPASENEEEEEDNDERFYHQIELEFHDEGDPDEDELYDTPQEGDLLDPVESSRRHRPLDPMSESDPHNDHQGPQPMDHTPTSLSRRDSDPISTDIDEVYEDAEENDNGDDKDADPDPDSSMIDGEADTTIYQQANTTFSLPGHLRGGDASLTLSSPSQSFIEAFTREEEEEEVPPSGPFSLNQSHQYQNQDS